MMVRRIAIAIFWAVAWLAATAAARAETHERRVALVIGNAAYQAPLPALSNAATDARDISRALEAAGFDTTVKIDVKRRDLYQLIDAFAAQIAASPDTVGLFYYAGHGIQTNGKNYLIPVDSALASESDLEAEAVDAGKVLRAMDQARNRINIVILDACRDNPLPKGRSLARGLTSMSAPRGTFIGYAAAPGQSALDGEPGQNGLFTGVLLKQLSVPGLQLEEVFKRTIAGVAERSAGRQMPWMESSVQGEFFFVPTARAPAVSPPQPVATPQMPAAQIDAEIAFVRAIPPNGGPAYWEEYLRLFPEGQFVGLARNRLADLKAPSQARGEASPAVATAQSQPVLSAPTAAPPNEPAAPAGGLSERPASAPPATPVQPPASTAPAPAVAMVQPPPAISNCGGNADAQILRPIMLLYDAVNRKDLDLYSQQLAPGLTYYNQTSHLTQNRDQKIESKKKAFDRIEKFSLKMDRKPEIVTRSDNSADIEVHYSMTYVIRGQPLTQNNILEKYTVVCDTSGRWLINGNVDEINAAGPPHH